MVALKINLVRILKLRTKTIFSDAFVPLLFLNEYYFLDDSRISIRISRVNGNIDNKRDMQHKQSRTPVTVKYYSPWFKLSAKISAAINDRRARSISNTNPSMVGSFDAVCLLNESIS